MTCDCCFEGQFSLYSFMEKDIFLYIFSPHMELFWRTWSHKLQPKIFTPVWQCQQLLSWLLANGHLPRVSNQSHLLCNDNGDNEMILGALHRSSGICLIDEENPSKPQLEDCQRMCDQSSPQMRSLTSKRGK